MTARANARPRDNVDSSQAVAATMQSLLHASIVGGSGGAGRGGQQAGGTAPGFGAEQPRDGARSGPLGDGHGALLDFDTRDPRYTAYFRKLHAKIDPLWRNAFPRQAALALEQGYVILEFVIASDGHATVKWPPKRPSGIDAFDRNCAEAIRRAQPFEPIPAALGPGPLRIEAPFVAKNPVIK